MQTIVSVTWTNYNTVTKQISQIMFDYKIIAYNKLGKVQETENLFCAPDEIDDNNV